MQKLRLIHNKTRRFSFMVMIVMLVMVNSFSVTNVIYADPPAQIEGAFL